MGLFSRKQPEPEPPVRRGKVMQIMAAYMAETDCPPDHPGGRNATERLHDTYKGATQAEILAAHKAAKRRGY